MSKTIRQKDDTTILISGKNQKNLYDNANEELNNIDNWLVTNKLSLNIDKKSACTLKPSTHL